MRAGSISPIPRCWSVLLLAAGAAYLCRAWASTALTLDAGSHSDAFFAQIGRDALAAYRRTESALADIEPDAWGNLETLPKPDGHFVLLPGALLPGNLPVASSVLLIAQALF